VALLAVGTMVQPALDAAARLAAEGLDPAVVNCRFLKPLDSAMLEQLLLSCRTLVTIEEGVVTNGFGAYLAGRLQVTHPEVRVVPIGIPDILHDQASRSDQLAMFGLTGEGIARRVTAGHHEESVHSR
jgi:1-deoxy-D-xylulose-5-phosphate synthase